MARQIVETSPGRYKDPKTNKRTSKKDGDQVLTKEQYEAAVKDTGSKGKTEAKPNAKKSGANKQAEKKEYGVLSSGKVAHGPTVEITCSKRGCGTKRTIMKSDKFQVKFCLEHAKEERNRLRRERRKAAKAKASK